MLEVYTTPSWYINHHRRSRLPFQRIVGLRACDDVRYWAPTDVHDGYIRARVDEQGLNLEADMAKRVIDFFQKHFVNGPTGDSYYCHSFAETIVGLTPAHVEIPSEEDTNVFARGQLGVVHDFEQSRKYHTFASSHSFVGLGEHETACLQVLATMGTMGIVDIATVRDIYIDQPGAEADMRAVTVMLFRDYVEQQVRLRYGDSVRR